MQVFFFGRSHILTDGRNVQRNDRTLNFLNSFLYEVGSSHGEKGDREAGVKGQRREVNAMRRLWCHLLKNSHLFKTNVTTATETWLQKMYN